MAIHIAHPPDQPFRDQPGRCPLCGAEVRPRAEEVVPIGSWDGRDVATGRPTGGPILGVNCPECGAVLRYYRSGSPEEADTAQTVWHSDGERVLVGGDRWRGRRGLWSDADTTQFADRLRDLVERVGALDDAVRILHLTTGLGGLHLSKLVEQVARLPPLDAKRLVVRAVSPYLGNGE